MTHAESAKRRKAIAEHILTFELDNRREAMKNAETLFNVSRTTIVAACSTHKVELPNPVCGKQLSCLRVIFLLLKGDKRMYSISREMGISSFRVYELKQQAVE